MIPLKELRINLNLSPEESSSHIKFFRKSKIDFDVFLPSINKNLQRGFVWTMEQKQNLIWSVLLGRHIPHCAILSIIDPDNESEEIFQIIDGKQRLSTLLFFVEDKFPLIVNGNEYTFSSLPEDYKSAILNYHFRYYIVTELHNNKISDEQKIAWFKFLNFAGTPQDTVHMEELKTAFNNRNLYLSKQKKHGQN